MAKSPAFQLYAADFYMDTSGWSATQIGIFFRLLMHEWVNGNIPDDWEMLSRIAQIGLGNFKKCYRTTIEGKFYKDGRGNLLNRRMEEIRIKQLEYTEHQRNSGYKGMLIKRERGIYPFNETSDPDPFATSDPTTDPASNPATHNQALQSSSSSSSSSSILKTYMQLFHKFWKTYPSRNGRKVTKQETIQYFKDNFKSEEEIGLLLKATENYSKSCKEGFAKDPIRFLKKDFWRDWIDLPEPKIEGDYPKYEDVMKRQGFTDEMGIGKAWEK